MHQLIYEYLTKRAATETADPASMTRRNSRVAPFSWLMTLCCAVPALAFWGQTQWLVTASLIFCATYLLLYRQLSSPGRD